MTKLYHGREGWKIPGQQGKGEIRADVPNNPGELAAWLNDRCVAADPERILDVAELEPQGTADFAPPAPAGDAPVDRHVNKHLEAARQQALAQCPKCSRRPSSAALAVQAEDLDAITHWITHEAKGGQVEQLFALLGARFHELRKENGQ